MVESRSEISANAGRAVATLRQLRRELAESGARLMGVGVHPNASPGAAEVLQTPRYALIEDSLQGVLRTPICGQHIHVGMPDKETAVRAYNGIRTHVPLLNALASNSPFWFGEDSGLIPRPPRAAGRGGRAVFTPGPAEGYGGFFGIPLKNKHLRLVVQC